MKKKFLLLVALIAVITTASFVFAGCNQASTQGQLLRIWNNHEVFEYVVTDNSTDIEKAPGSYKVTISKKDAGDVPFGDDRLTNAPAGYLVTGELNMGEDTVITQTYFKMVNGMKYVSSYATYRKEHVNNKDYTMSGLYDGSTLNYTEKVDDGEVTKGSLSASEPFYDNNLMHQTFRSISTLSNGFQFAFNTPVVSRTEDVVANLAISIIDTPKIKVPYTENLPADNELKKDGIPTYKGYIQRRAAVGGMAQDIYIASSKININNWDLTNVIVKIVEPTNIDGHKGNITYELKSISL